MITPKQFNVIVGRIRVAQGRGDFTEVYKLLEEINQNGTSEMIADGYLISGRTKRDHGLISEARTDWLEGVQHATEKTFTLYLLYRNIGASYKESKMNEEAVMWYGKALRTCADGEMFSGQLALMPYLELNEGTIPGEDRDVVAHVLQKSWRVHRFPGEPDLNNLPASILELEQRFTDLVEKTINENMSDADGPPGI